MLAATGVPPDGREDEDTAEHEGRVCEKESGEVDSECKGRGENRKLGIQFMLSGVGLQFGGEKRRGK